MYSRASSTYPVLNLQPDCVGALSGSRPQLRGLDLVVEVVLHLPQTCSQAISTILAVSQIPGRTSDRYAA